MIFTDRFVYVHKPKTGGTFVTSTLFRLHGAHWNRLHLLKFLIFKQKRYTGKYGTFIFYNNKHGGCREIPEPQRGKLILTTLRNPYDLYVSQYEFGWWRKSEFLKYYRRVPNFATDYPRFPEITFAEYIKLANDAFRKHADGASDSSPGLLTEQFVEFYFKHPSQAVSKIRTEEDYAFDCRADMFHIHFIRTDRLNRELYEFLLSVGYEERDIEFILSAEKVLPQGSGRTAEQKWEKYYTPCLKREVRRREDFLFRMFPEFDV